ncbi:MAG: hypothetical protein P4M13_10620 [Alphaproteobacteria bacterium]|nr:hypothetical protein [Alphaproteobacteria bacterium]
MADDHNPGTSESRAAKLIKTIDALGDRQASVSTPKNNGVKAPERPGTKTLDYIALGLLLAPPAVVVEMYIKNEAIDWTRTTVATIACWVVGGLFVLASHRWQSLRPISWRVLPYLVAAESRFWVKALIVAAAIGGALALSSFLSTPPHVIHDVPTAEEISKATAPLQAELQAANEKLKAITQPASEADLAKAKATQAADDQERIAALASQLADAEKGRDAAQQQVVAMTKERDAEKQRADAATKELNLKKSSSQPRVPPAGPAKIIRSDMKEQMYRSALSIKVNTKAAVVRINTPPPYPNKTEFSLKLADIFSQAGFAVYDGSQTPTSPTETGVMICTNDVDAPSDIDVSVKKMFNDVGIDATFIPISEAKYHGDVTIFLGPDL